MGVEKAFSLQTFGSLRLTNTSPTLAQIEEFCTEARRLGLPDKAMLRTSRQGLLGPVEAWYFDIPVTPKESNATDI